MRIESNKRVKRRGGYLLSSPSSPLCMNDRGLFPCSSFFLVLSRFYSHKLLHLISLSTFERSNVPMCIRAWRTGKKYLHHILFCLTDSFILSPRVSWPFL